MLKTNNGRELIVHNVASVTTRTTDGMFTVISESGFALGWLSLIRHFPWSKAVKWVIHE